MLSLSQCFWSWYRTVYVGFGRSRASSSILCSVVACPWANRLAQTSVDFAKSFRYLRNRLPPLRFSHLTTLNLPDVADPRLSLLDSRQYKSLAVQQTIGYTHVCILDISVSFHFLLNKHFHFCLPEAFVWTFIPVVTESCGLKVSDRSQLAQHVLNRKQFYRFLAIETDEKQNANSGRKDLSKRKRKKVVDSVKWISPAREIKDERKIEK